MKYRVEASNEREADNSDDDRVSVSSDVSVNTEEDLIIKANEHVEQAIAQSTQSEGNLCCLHFFYLFYHANFFSFSFSYCMCVVFAQNMDVPHFGEEQPADIYITFHL